MELMEWVFLTIILVMIGKGSYAEIGKIEKLVLTAVFLYIYFEEGLHIQIDTLVINEIVVYVLSVSL